MSTFPLKPTHKPVKAYFDALATFTKHGHTTEGNTRSAFADLLKRCCPPYGWHLVEEYQFKGTNRKPLRADGALVDDLTLVHGLWESQGRRRRPHQRDHPQTRRRLSPHQHPLPIPEPRRPPKSQPVLELTARPLIEYNSCMIEDEALISALAYETVDNEAGSVARLQQVSDFFQTSRWPSEYVRTTHCLRPGDARDLSWIPNDSVHLVVTSPPYWTLKEYVPHEGQMGAIEDYEQFLCELDRVWKECARVLVPGGRVCCVVGDVCIPRKRGGRHRVMPLHADIMTRTRKFDLDCLTPILWQKISNGATEAEGNGAGFYGKPYQPGAIVKNDFEYVLFLRKGGSYRSPTPMQRALSVLTKTQMQQWLRTSWTDIKGESTRKGHPAPYPVELAERLVRLFSFVGDTVLDPFAGTGTTSIAAMNSGRNSIANEVEPRYLTLATERLFKAQVSRPFAAPFDVDIVLADAIR